MGVLWDFMRVTAALGMTKGRRDKPVLGCQGLGAGSRSKQEE